MTAWMGLLESPGWVLVALGVIVVLLFTLQVSSEDAYDVANAPSTSSGASARTPTSKDRAVERQEPIVPDAAKDVAKRLGIRVGARRVPVTICINDVVLARTKTGGWSAIDSAVRAITLLNQVASLYLIAWVDSDEEEKLIESTALSVGLTRSSEAAGVPHHRLLFCSSHIGQVAIVRQLTPSLHIGGSVALLEGISRFVPSLVRIDPDAVEHPPEPNVESTLVPPERLEGLGGQRDQQGKTGGDTLGWREYTTLASAAGLPAQVSEEVSNTSFSPEADPLSKSAAGTRNSNLMHRFPADEAATASASALDRQTDQHTHKPS